MLKTLVLFAHPAVEKSRVNRRLAAAVRELPGLTFHDLYEAYPEFDVDVGREQELLVEHDLIVRGARRSPVRNEGRASGMFRSQQRRSSDAR